MAGTSDIIAQGIGSWGSVNKIPTLGFGSGEANPDVTARGVDYVITDGRPQYIADCRPQYIADQ